MQIRFLHKRSNGTLQVNDIDGTIKVECDDLVLKRKLVRFLRSELKPPVKGTHPGLNEITEVHFKRKFEKKLKLMEEEFGIWIWNADRSLQNSPWFATKDFDVLKYNNCRSNPWYIIEDVGTGCQAFYKLWSPIENLLWLPTSLVNVVEYWQNRYHQIDISGDVVEKTRYTLLRWNGMHDDDAIFVVRDNFENTQSLFTPGQCKNLRWNTTDLSNEPEYKEWSDFGDERVENLEWVMV